MTRRHVAVFLASFLVSFGVALATFWPSRLEATGGPPKGKSLIQRPTLIVNQCELSLLPDDDRPLEAGQSPYKVGDKPQFRLVASGMGSDTASIQCTVRILSRRPISPEARMLPRPTVIYQRALLVEAPSGQTSATTLEDVPALPAGNITITLEAGGKTITAMSFATAAELTPVPQIRVR